MELNNYRSANTPKKKKKKITASAAVVFCILSLIVGIVCGKSSSSGLDPRITEMTKNLDNYQEAVDTYEAEIKARKDELTKIYHELAEAKKEQKALAQQSVQEPASNDDDATESKKETLPKTQESSGSGILGKLIIGALVIVIIVCILFAVSIFLKKNESDEDESDEDEYEDEDEDEYDEYYEEDDDDDSDEEYEDDEDEEYDAQDDDEE